MTKVWIVVCRIHGAADVDVFSDSAEAEKYAEIRRLSAIEKFGERPRSFITIEILEKEVHTTTPEF